MVPGDHGTGVFRSDRRSDLHRARPWIAAACAVAVAVLVVAVRAGAVAVAGVAGVVAAVAAVLLVVLLTSRAVVTVGRDAVELTRWTGRRVVLPRDDGLLGLRARFASSLGTQSGRPRLVMRHRSARGRISMVEGPWTAHDIEHVAALVGIPTADDVLDGRDWQARAPGLLPWPERRPYTTVALAVTASLVVLVAAIELAG